MPIATTALTPTVGGRDKALTRFAETVHREIIWLVSPAELLKRLGANGLVCQPQ